MYTDVSACTYTAGAYLAVDYVQRYGQYSRTNERTSERETQPPIFTFVLVLCAHPDGWWVDGKEGLFSHHPPYLFLLNKTRLHRACHMYHTTTQETGTHTHKKLKVEKCDVSVSQPASRLLQLRIKPHIYRACYIGSGDYWLTHRGKQNQDGQPSAERTGLESVVVAATLCTSGTPYWTRRY